MAQESRGERQRKAHRRRPVLRPGRGDLMQGVAGEPAAQSGIERAREREPSRGPPAGRPASASISAMARLRRAIPSALPPGDIRSASCSSHLFLFWPKEGELKTAVLSRD